MTNKAYECLKNHRAGWVFSGHLLKQQKLWWAEVQGGGLPLPAFPQPGGITPVKQPVVTGPLGR